MLLRATDVSVSRRSVVGLVLAWLAAMMSIGIWLVATPEATLRAQLVARQFWWLEAVVVLLLGLGVVMARRLWRMLELRERVHVAALAVLAIGLVTFVPPRTNRIFYDEQIYQGVAQNLADLKRAQMCHDGTVEYGRLQCSSGEYNKQPYAYPHLLSLVYRVVGVGPTAVFALNALVMVASVVVVYLSTLLLFGDRTAAFFAGLLLALMPEQLLWSATAAVEPSAALACSAALLAAVMFCRERDSLSLTGAAVAAAYAVQFRPESALLLPAVGLLIWQSARSELARPRFWWAALLAFVLVAVHLAHLYAVRNEGWGTTEARLSFEYVLDNLRVNGPFFLVDERFPALCTVLAVAGVAAPRQETSRAPLVYYFAAFFGISLLFYAGSYNYGADVRYSLTTFPPIVILGGLGASHVVGWLNRVRPGLPATGVCTAVLIFQFLWYAPLVRATAEEAWAARADVTFAAAVAPELGTNSYVLTQNPSMFHVIGVNAGQLSTVVANPSYLDYLATRYRDGIYLHWNFWCNVHDPVQQDLCRRAMALKPTHAVRERVVRDQRFGFYRFQIAPVAPVP